MQGEYIFRQRLEQLSKDNMKPVNQKSKYFFTGYVSLCIHISDEKPQNFKQMKYACTALTVLKP